MHWLMACIFYHYYYSSSIRPNVLLRRRTPCRQPSRPLWSVKTKKTKILLRQRPLRTIRRTILLYKKMKAWKSDPAWEAKRSKNEKKTWAILQDFMFFLFFPSSSLLLYNAYYITKRVVHTIAWTPRKLLLTWKISWNWIIFDWKKLVKFNFT